MLIPLKNFGMKSKSGQDWDHFDISHVSWTGRNFVIRRSEKFERRSTAMQSKMDQNYPINFLDKTAKVSMKDLFELESLINFEQHAFQMATNWAYGH